MSIWEDKQGRKHVGVMVGGKRVHRILPEGATSGDAKRIEAEIRGAIEKMPRQANIPGDPCSVNACNGHSGRVSHWGVAVLSARKTPKQPSDYTENCTGPEKQKSPHPQGQGRFNIYFPRAAIPA